MATQADQSSTYEARTPIDELKSRRDRLVTRLQERGVTLAIISTPLNIYYLTGIDLGGYITPQALVVRDDGRALFVVRATEMTWLEHWSRYSWCTDWVAYTDGEEPYDVIADAARKLNGQPVKRLGLESDRPSMPHTVVAGLVAALEPRETECVTEATEGLRRTKSETELEHIRQAGQMTMRGVHAAADAIIAGSTDAEAVSEAFTAMVKAGASLFSDVPYVPVGPESARAHGHWNHQKPQAGETVTLMMTGSAGRYQCPVERTFVLGQPDARTAHILETAATVQEAVQAALRPGMASHDADRLARTIYEEEGLAEYFLNRLAYSFGAAYPPCWWENEIMQIRPNDLRLLEPGMVFHVVPCLYIPDVGFVNRSMPTVITDDGCAPLIDWPIRQELI